MESATIAEAVRLAGSDAEFSAHAAGWAGSLTLVVDGRATVIRITDGLPALAAGEAAPPPRRTLTTSFGRPTVQPGASC